MPEVPFAAFASLALFAFFSALCNPPSRFLWPAAWSGANLDVMNRSLPAIPALPALWPFERRSPAQAPVCSPGIEIPGLGAGWTLIASPELDLGGAAQGLEGAFGRGGVRRLGEVVLRPYRRGGLVRHLNAGIYLSPARFAQEFLVHRALWLAGFPTVEPLGYALRHRAWGFEGLFLTRYAEGSPWPRHWDSGTNFLAQLRGRIEALCAWGLFSPDLNATNVMITPEGEALLLDWDRAAWGGRDLFPRYRARLLRSLTKLGAPLEVRRDVEGWRLS